MIVYLLLLARMFIWLELTRYCSCMWSVDDHDDIYKGPDEEGLRDELSEWMVFSKSG